MAWTDEAKEKAKREGRWLYKITLQGKHQKPLCGPCIDGSGTLTREQALRILAILDEPEQQESDDDDPHDRG